MRNGFVRNLVVFVVFGIGYYALFDGRSSQAGALLGTVLLGLGMCVAADMGWRGADARSRRRAIERSLGGAPFEDGALVAATGTIQATEGTLLAPFTARPCLAYEYRIAAAQGHQMPLATSMAGVALAPSVIASQSGDARLLDWPGLDRLAESECDEERHRENARAFVTETAFETGALTGSFSKLDNPVADARGSLRIDVATGNDTNPDRKRLTERIVPAGARVCAIGTWSIARGGIVGDSSGTRVELFPGAPDALLDQLARRATGLTAGAVAVAAAVNAVAWIAWR